MQKLESSWQEPVDLYWVWGQRREARDGLGWLRGWSGVSKSSLKPTLLWCQVLSCSQCSVGKEKVQGPGG